jgi:hypothetical protein
MGSNLSSTRPSFISKLPPEILQCIIEYVLDGPLYVEHWCTPICSRRLRYNQIGWTSGSTINPRVCETRVNSLNLQLINKTFYELTTALQSKGHTVAVSCFPCYKAKMKSDAMRMNKNRDSRCDWIVVEHVRGGSRTLDYHSIYYELIQPSLRAAANQRQKLAGT